MFGTKVGQLRSVLQYRLYVMFMFVWHFALGSGVDLAVRKTDCVQVALIVSKWTLGLRESRASDAGHR
jgi:hypothetical protein